MGLPTGICAGNGRSMNLYAPEVNFYTSAIVAGTCSIAAGVALGLKRESVKRHPNYKPPMVWCFCGDGAEDHGHFMEAVRFGLARNLPLTFVVEDNDHSVDATKRARWGNYQPIRARNVLRYTYQRTWPHVGVGEHINF